MSVDVRLNGEAVSLPQGATLADAVARLTPATAGVAAALNEDVVPRTRWDATPLAAGDRVEVVTAVQGG